MSLAKLIYVTGFVIISLIVLWALGFAVKLLSLVFALVSIPFTVVGHLFGANFVWLLCLVGLAWWFFRKRGVRPVSSSLKYEMTSLESRLDRLNRSLASRRY